MVSRITLAFAALCLIYACTQVVDLRPEAPAVALPTSAPAPEETIKPTPLPTFDTAEVLVLGDSQISFGAGGAYTAFFANLEQNCGAMPPGFARAEAAAIGVRSTALHHWTARDSETRGMICDVDEKFGVNAGSYGVTSAGRTYVQIGADPNYPFCPTGRSPLEAVFETPKYDPDLVVLAFLGNATDRWQNAANARNDWQTAAAQLPGETPCIVMTTIPSYMGDENDRRSRAQSNLAAAVTGEGTCAFVPGFTSATRRAIEGNAAYFRTDASGAVTDPRHPTASSAETFIDIQTPALCAAVAAVLPK